MSAWVCSTWLADCISSPPTLTISGSEMGCALTFFRLLSCLCRHSLMVADINRNAFLSVTKLHPTLLISQPSASHKMLTLWNASNHRGVFVVGGQGKVHSVSGSKAIFLGMADSSSEEESIHLTLPVRHPGPPLDEHCEAEFAKRLQPQLLMYRLRNFRTIRESCYDMRKPKLSKSELAHNLTICV